MKILVDIEERRSSVPDHLEKLGVDVELVSLPHGDYLVDPRCVVERKTVADLHRSIASARLWSQLAGLARLDRPYLIVEGPRLDSGPISGRGVRGAVLQIMDNGVAVIRSEGQLDTAVWLRLLAVRGGRSGPVLGSRGRRRGVASPVALLAAVPGISPTIANRLMERFGTVAGITQASSSELAQVPGIGPIRADSVRRALLGTFPRSGEVP